MKGTVLYGNKIYTDSDLSTYRYQFIVNWDKYYKETYPKFKEQYAQK